MVPIGGLSFREYQAIFEFVAKRGKRASAMNVIILIIISDVPCFMSHICIRRFGTTCRVVEAKA